MAKDYCSFKLKGLEFEIAGVNEEGANLTISRLDPDEVSFAGFSPGDKCVVFALLFPARPDQHAGGAWLIAIFLVPVTITVHGYLLLHAPDEANRQAQLSFFLKGITMTGAALLFTQLGVSRSPSSPPASSARSGSRG